MLISMLHVPTPLVLKEIHHWTSLYLFHPRVPLEFLRPGEKTDLKRIQTSSEANANRDGGDDVLQGN